MTLAELIARDGGCCVWCGASPWRSDLTAEHLLPRSRGGRGLPENLAVACRRCNRRRRSRSVSAYARARLNDGLPADLPRIAGTLERLSGLESGAHAAYGRRQLNLLARLMSSLSSEPR